MAWKVSKRRVFGSRFNRRNRRTPYELQNLAICRLPMPTGLTSCGLPDKFFTQLVGGMTEWESDTSAGPAVTVGAPTIVKGVVVGGLRFDYHYSYVPVPIEDAAQRAAGVCSLRSAVIVFPNDPLTGTLPDAIATLPGGILDHHEPAIAEGGTTKRPKFRILWRGLDTISTVNVILGETDPFKLQIASNPHNHMGHRSVRIRSKVRLDEGHSLWFYTECINPFLTFNPTFALDLLGVAAVKPMWRGNTYR